MEIHHRDPPAREYLLSLLSVLSVGQRQCEYQDCCLAQVHVLPLMANIQWLIKMEEYINLLILHLPMGQHGGATPSSRFPVSPLKQSSLHLSSLSLLSVASFYFLPYILIPKTFRKKYGQPKLHLRFASKSRDNAMASYSKFSILRMKFVSIILYWKDWL